MFNMHSFLIWIWKLIGCVYAMVFTMSLRNSTRLILMQNLFWISNKIRRRIISGLIESNWTFWKLSWLFLVRRMNKLWLLHILIQTETSILLPIIWSISSLIISWCRVSLLNRGNSNIVVIKNSVSVNLWLWGR
jgi:hypothetical protein